MDSREYEFFGDICAHAGIAITAKKLRRLVDMMFLMPPND